MKLKKLASDIIEVLIFVFVLIIAIICLKGFLECTHAFSDSQQLYSQAYAEASTAIVTAADQSGNIEELIRHLEQLQTVQKNSLTNDLMSFVYGVLSTILVGLCAGFVVKSQKNAQTAQNAADSVEKKEVEIEAISDEAKKKLNEVNKIKNEINEVFENIRDEFEAIKQNNIKQQIKIQENFGTFLALHVEIIHARTALMSFDQVESNTRIYSILTKIKSINSVFDKKAVAQLRTELLVLKSVIDAFESKIDIEFTSPQKNCSMHCSAKRYEEEVTQAIKECDKMLNPI